MASGEPTNGNILHTAPAKHNTGTIMVVHNDATDDNIQHMASVELGTSAIPGVVVVDADGIAVANEDAMPIAVVDYR
jgi:hypothetical protein